MVNGSIRRVMPVALEGSNGKDNIYVFFFKIQNKLH